MEARALAVLLARLSRSGEVIAAPEKVKYLKDYLECRTPAKGGRVLRCGDCGTYAVAYNACNRRGCPVCSRKNQLNWQVKMRHRLLPTAHHHLVFSFPKRLTDEWTKHPRATVTLLFDAVRKVIRRLERERGLTLGTTLVFQSHCHGLAYKAHVHCLVSSGGLDDQDHWRGLGTLPLGEMTKWLKSRLGGLEAEKGWRIHESHHQSGGEAVVQYLGQRLNGSVVAAKEVSEERERVIIEGRGGSVELSPETFVLRYLNHIPAKGTVLVRNCGLYSNRQTLRLEIARAQLGAFRGTDDERPADSCPRCKGKMTTVMNSVMRPLEFDHENLGFGTDPPTHWELSMAS